jgi:hypothetical protein
MALKIVGQVNLAKVAKTEAKRENRKKRARALSEVERSIKVTQTEIHAFVRSIDALHRRQGKRLLSKDEVLALANATIRERKLAQASLAKGIKL